MSVIAKHKQGMLFMLVGPGGVGKNAILDQLLSQMDGIKQLATATTRPPRKGEEHGKQRLFVSLDEFKQMIANGQLVEYQEVHPGVYYGVPKQVIETAFREGQDLVADIDFHGATVIRAGYLHNTIALFIAPPNMDILMERLIARGETPQSIQDRIHRSAEEMLYAPLADFVVVNWHLPDAVKQAMQLINDIRNHISMPIATTLTTFTAHLTLIKANADPQLHTITIPKGEHPTAVVARFLREHDMAYIPEKLLFGTPPVQVRYEQHLRNYYVTYYFRYED